MARKPDEIMAEYLLNGAKMLSELCPVCGAPMFEVKGKKVCVVCRETGAATPAAQVAENPKPEDNIRVIVPNYAKEQPAFEQNALNTELDALILELCKRAKEETDASQCLKITECIRTAAEAKVILSR